MYFAGGPGCAGAVPSLIFGARLEGCQRIHNESTTGSVAPCVSYIISTEVTMVGRRWQTKSTGAGRPHFDPALPGGPSR